MTFVKRLGTYLFIQTLGMLAPIGITLVIYGLDAKVMSNSELNVSLIFGSQVVLDFLCAWFIFDAKWLFRVLFGLLMLCLRFSVFSWLMSWAYQYVIIDKVYDYFTLFVVWVPISI